MRGGRAPRRLGYCSSRGLEMLPPSATAARSAGDGPNPFSGKPRQTKVYFGGFEQNVALCSVWSAATVLAEPADQSACRIIREFWFGFGELSMAWFGQPRS